MWNIIPKNPATIDISNAPNATRKKSGLETYFWNHIGGPKCPVPDTVSCSWQNMSCSWRFVLHVSAHKKGQIYYQVFCNMFYIDLLLPHAVSCCNFYGKMKGNNSRYPLLTFHVWILHIKVEGYISRYTL